MLSYQLKRTSCLIAIFLAFKKTQKAGGTARKRASCRRKSFILCCQQKALANDINQNAILPSNINYKR